MKFIVSLLFVVFSFTSANAQGEGGIIKGTVKDSKTGDPIPFANVILLEDSSSIVMGATTDIDGNYLLKEIEPGKYKLIIQYVAYSNKEIYKVKVKAGSILNMNHSLVERDVCCNLPIAIYEIPIIRTDLFGTSITFTREDIRHSPY